MDEAELLFTDLLKCDRMSLYQNKDTILDKDKGRLAASVLKRRSEGEPLQHILGKSDFFGFEFKVTPDVLIPRPETEILVEAAIGYIRKEQTQETTLDILELGTGSGCIAVSLAKSLQGIYITATDISGKALAVARENVFLSKVSESITLLQSDLFYLCNRAYDVIISNPPYIPSSEIEKLQPEIQFEPRIALDGGSDGLHFYRRIISEGAHYLKSGGLLLLEIGLGELEGVKNIFSGSREFQILHVVIDHNKIDRVIVAKRTGEYGQASN
jgi:release factor glutamine methyltransferase